MKSHPSSSACVYRCSLCVTVDLAHKMLSWQLATLCMAWSTCEQCVEERLKTIVQGGVSRECLVVLLNIAAQHPCKAYTHLLQAAASDSIYLCASTHPDLRTASLITSSTQVKGKETLTIRSICCPPT